MSESKPAADMTDEEILDMLHSCDADFLDILIEYMEITLAVRKPDAPKVAIEWYDALTKAVDEGRVTTHGGMRAYLRLIRGALEQTGECA